MYTCPKGHQSTDSDYCSECGSLIGTSSLSADQTATITSPATGSDICPDCGTPRDGNNRYCEVCRYDFQNKSSFAASAPGITPVPAESALSAASPAPTTAPVPGAAPQAAKAATFVVAQKLNIEVMVDPSLATDPDEVDRCPKDAPKRTFPLDLEENLVGRRSDTKGVYPEIEVDDPGASRRHLKLIRQSDGCFAALELGSSNGTIMNGIALVPGIVTPVNVGDEFAIGSWTRLRVTER